MARFHNYSFGNIMLIARQKPQATNVAGIRTWNSLGRFVKRGEKGIIIPLSERAQNLISSNSVLGTISEAATSQIHSVSASTSADGNLA